MSITAYPKWKITSMRRAWGLPL